MMNFVYNIGCFFLVFATSGYSAGLSGDPVRGIFVNQHTVQSKSKFTTILSNAKAVGINTLVVDYHQANPVYAKNIKAITKDEDFWFVARIIVFPYGGNIETVASKAHISKRLQLIAEVIALGADEILLDYIRYDTKHKPIVDPAKNIHKVIKVFDQYTEDRKTPLSIATFGDTAFGPVHNIGQDVGRFWPDVDSVYPMLYPSHFASIKHSQAPYKIISKALIALRKQLVLAQVKKQRPIVSFIEAWNYRYPMEDKQLQTYIAAQMNAVKDLGEAGWIVWSATNKYINLWEVLKNNGT